MPASRKTRNADTAGIEAAEIKVTIRPDQELLAERALELSGDAAEKRTLYFYDTAQLDLFDAGLALRARLIKDDDDDSTVKIRPVEPEDIAEGWRDEEGFKLEADYVGDRVVISASLTVVQNRDEIDAVAEGKRPIGKLFSKEQERFLEHFYKREINFRKLRVLGPIDVLRWKLKPKSFAHQITVEEWRLADGDDLIEVSIKTAPQRADKAKQEFEEFLRSLNLDPEGDQEAKTRRALQYFAQRSPLQ